MRGQGQDHVRENGGEVEKMGDLEKGSWGETFLPNIKHHSMQMDNIKFFFNIVVVPLRLWLRTNSKIYVPVMFELYTGRKGLTWKFG